MLYIIPSALGRYILYTYNFTFLHFFLIGLTTFSVRFSGVEHIHTVMKQISTTPSSCKSEALDPFDRSPLLP